MNKNCLTYWLPKLQLAGVPVPRTELLKMPERCRKAIWSMLDGGCSEAAAFDAPFDAFVARLEMLGDEVGYPCFLRTGQFSGKHNWQDTCYVRDRARLASHVCRLAEMSELIGGIGGELPWNVWAVRELLPTQPICTLPAYGNFPLVPEVRCFVRDGAIQCVHSYWPTDAIKQGFPASEREDWWEVPPNFEELAHRAQTFDDGWRPIAAQVATAFADDGYWSVDLLPTPTRRGWYYVTDMAIGEQSFHWPGCPNELTRQGE